MKSEKRIPFWLIVRHLRHTNKWTLLFIIFLMSVAFINLVFMNSLFSGVIETDNNQIINTRTGNITVGPPGGSSLVTDAAGELKKIDSVKGVVAAAPETTFPAIIEFINARDNVDVVAMDPALEKRVTVVSRKMTEGSYLEPGDDTGIIVGQALIGEEDDENTSMFKDLRTGDLVTVILGESREVFRVRGVFKTKFEMVDNRAYITRGGLERLTRDFSGGATGIVVKTEKKDDEARVVGDLQAAGVNGTFTTWQQAAKLVKALTNSFATINTLLTVVGFIIAAVTIFIIIYVDITHRRLEIGILRAVGVKPYLVTSTFVLQAVVYSFLGVALGTALFFGIIVPYFHFYPFAIPIGDVTLMVSPADFVPRAVAVVAVATLSSLIPAIISMRKPILDAILGR